MSIQKTAKITAQLTGFDLTNLINRAGLYETTKSNLAQARDMKASVRDINTLVGRMNKEYSALGDTVVNHIVSADEMTNAVQTNIRCKMILDSDEKALLPLMAMKSRKEILSLAEKSESMAKLAFFTGDLCGIGAGDKRSILNRLCPEQVQELDSICKYKDELEGLAKELGSKEKMTLSVNQLNENEQNQLEILGSGPTTI